MSDNADFILEPNTGIRVQSVSTFLLGEEQNDLLRQIAQYISRELSRIGVLSLEETEGILIDYTNQLEAGSLLKTDFVDYIAEWTLARRNSAIDTHDQEVTRIQRMIKDTLPVRMTYWTFGTPGLENAEVTKTYEKLLTITTLLHTPSVFAGENINIHTFSINPVAVLVTAAYMRFWIKEWTGDEPSVFPLIIEPHAWRLHLERGS
jgi:hypothetical protein